MQPSLANGKQKLEALTALRFMAASCIVFHHLRGSFGIARDAYPSCNLGSAVSFFFVLSGFVLAYAYPRLSSWAEVSAFIIRRWFRVWPLHFACLLILLVFMPQLLSQAAGSFQWLELASNILLLQAWVPLSAFYFSFNTVSWSISVEWFFYLCFPFLLWLMIRRNSALPALWASFLPLVVILFLCAAFNVPDYDGVKNQLTTHGLIYIGPVVRLLEFAVGMALQRTISGRKQLPGVARHVWILQLLSLAVAAWFVVRGMALSAKPWMPHVFAIWFNYSGGLPVWAFVIWSFSFSAWPATLLSNRLFVALGDASYAIYLVHFSIAHSAAERLFVLFHVENSTLQLALYFILVIGASFGLYYAVERPGMAVGKFLARCVYSKQALPSPKRPTATIQESVGDCKNLQAS